MKSTHTAVAEGGGGGWMQGKRNKIILLLGLISALVLYTVSQVRISPPPAKAATAITTAPTIAYTAPPFSQRPANTSWMMTCQRAQNASEFDMVRQLTSLLAENEKEMQGKVFLSLTTKDTMPALAIQLASMREFAPKALNHMVIICVGNVTCARCKEMHKHCLADFYMEDLLQGATGADSLSHDDSAPIMKAYVDIIWRKPELISLALQAGARVVGVVDTDGVWLNNPPLEDEDNGFSIQCSSEFPEQLDYIVDQRKCTQAMRFRGSPLNLNSGTVIIRNDLLGRDFIRDWIAFRASKPSGLCSDASALVDREEIMLDQDGLNSVVCLKGKSYSEKVLGLSSQQVLLNSVHEFLRGMRWYDICKPWFFHATNCGGTKSKPGCMEKNLARRRKARCEPTFSL